MFGKILLYYHTLRPLRFSQLVWRLYYRFVFKRMRVKPPQGHPTINRVILKHQFITSQQTVSSTHPLCFNFLNVKGKVSTELDWNASSSSKLWLYNLHYHAFLNEDLPFTHKVEILERWINENPISKAVAWDPYPLSLRIVNWVKFYLSHPDATHLKFEKSLALQAELLFHQIEYHLLGNHLFENAKALFFVGCLIQNARGQKYLKKAISLLHQQLDEQILQDGFHFERSPMYHALILEGILDLYVMLIHYPVDFSLEEKIRNLIPCMLEALTAVTHPNGGLVYFNDTSNGVAPSSAELSKYAQKLGFKPPNLPGNFKIVGFHKITHPIFSCIIDAGNIGPSYLPGHAHAQSLTFEMSVFDETLIVNPGISTYENNAQRRNERATAAHNCVQFDGKNTAEIWGSFRVGRKPKVKITHESTSELHAELSKIPTLPHIIHKRHFYTQDDAVLIKESFSKAPTPKSVFFHLHPDFEVVENNNENVICFSSQTKKKISIRFSSDSSLRLFTENYDYYVKFNEGVDAQKIRVKLDTQASSLTTRIELCT